MKPCDCQTKMPDPLEAVELMEYLTKRQEPIQQKQNQDVEALIDAWLNQACAARRCFRAVATPALQATWWRSVQGELAEDYQRAVDHFSNRGTVPFVEMLDEAMELKDVQGILKRSHVRSGLIDQVRDMVKKSQWALRVDGGTLVIESPLGIRKVLNDAKELAPDDSLLGSIARTWPSKGRGLAAIVVSDLEGEAPLTEVSWRDGLAQGLVYGEWFLDRDVRNLQDLRALPAVEGNYGGAIALVVAAAVVAVGFLLTWIAKCVDDPDTALVLRVIGEVLSLGWIVHAVSGVPIEECRTDPDTGARRCSRI